MSNRQPRQPPRPCRGGVSRGVIGAARSLPRASPDRMRLVGGAVKTWTGELVDLGGRNTLLYYRDLKQGTLDIGPYSGAEPVALDALLGSRTVRLSEMFNPEA